MPERRVSAPPCAPCVPCAPASGPVLCVRSGDSSCFHRFTAFVDSLWVGHLVFKKMHGIVKRKDRGHVREADEWCDSEYNLDVVSTAAFFSSYQNDAACHCHVSCLPLFLLYDETRGASVQPWSCVLTAEASEVTLVVSSRTRQHHSHRGWTAQCVAGHRPYRFHGKSACRWDHSQRCCRHTVTAASAFTSSRWVTGGGDAFGLMFSCG